MKINSWILCLVVFELQYILGCASSFKRNSELKAQHESHRFLNRQFLDIDSRINFSVISCKMQN